jgi:protein-ribulosamine 3-kinase
VRVPRVISLEGEKLVLERLALGARPDWPAMGRMLASLHRHTAPQFGWATDNWIGLAPQQNGWSDDWVDFFFSKRLIPQLERAGGNGFTIPLPSRSLLEGHRPRPSLLHGDLWNGNAGFVPDGPVFFDPAVYYGDREADLAMTELFGGFPAQFYAAYEKELPLAPGYERRRDLYNLYHVLNHLNIFGGSYLGQARSLAARLQ